MAESNESQGLKIAVAAFITITVILAVTSYFLYASVSTAQARLDTEREARAMDKRVAALALRQYDTMRTRVGTKAEEFDAAMEEISASFKKIDERLKNLVNAVNAALQTAQQNGAQGPELENAKLSVQRAVASYRSEPNKNYISTLDRLSELTENLSNLATQLALKYPGASKSPEGATGAAKDKKDQEPKAKDQGRPNTKD